MPLAVSQRILIALALVMLLWYVVGTWYNRRKGIRSLNWLREGLGSLGGELQAAWIGSAASGARVAVHKAAPPFRHVETIFLLQSREVAPLWLLNWLRGRRDELIIKADLRSPRRGEIEVVPVGSRLERSLRQESSWRWQSGPHSLHIAHRGRQNQALTTIVMPFLQRYGPYLRHFSCRRDKPHLLLKVRLAGLADCSPANFFKDLTAIFGDSAGAQ